MKITQLIDRGVPFLSFEVFPPKVESRFSSVRSAVEEIARLRPAFMSVTFGAGGGTSRYTLEIAQNIQALYGVPTLAHLTCVSSTRETVRQKISEIREAGITVPVIPGIMPITNANQVSRSIKLSGSFMPQRFKSLVDRFGSDPAAMKQAGIAYATDQIIDLYANGITHIHVYSMNKPDVAEKIQSNLSAILGR